MNMYCHVRNRIAEPLINKKVLNSLITKLNDERHLCNYQANLTFEDNGKIVLYADNWVIIKDYETVKRHIIRLKQHDLRTLGTRSFFRLFISATNEFIFNNCLIGTIQEQIGLRVAYLTKESKVHSLDYLTVEEAITNIDWNKLVNYLLEYDGSGPFIANSDGEERVYEKDGITLYYYKIE